MQKRGTLLATGLIGISIILSGCFQGEQSLEDLDPPQDAEAVDSLDNVSEKESKSNETKGGTEDKESDNNADTTAQETVMRQLFLIDANGMVVPQTLEIPKAESKEVALQALEYLVKGGPIQNIVPNGFQAVLPAGTEILGLDLEKDGTLIVDVSEEFKNYQPENELEILQAMTYTLTQFDSVKDIKLQINGYPQESMPVNGTPIGDGYSRADGINVVNTDTVDLIDSKAVTLYYPTVNGDSKYFTPVTQHINSGDDNLYQSIFQALLHGPGYDLNVKSVFNSNASLVAEPTLDNGVLQLTFNEGILKDPDKQVVGDEVMETLVRTMTAQKNVDSIQVKVENVEKLFNENGKVYDKPVTTDMFAPTGKF